ncbi:MAG: IS110 family transposase [Anaerolineales bacterium]
MIDREMTTPSASDCDPARCFVAIELSKASWLIGVHTPVRDKTSLYKLPAGQAAPVLALMATTRKKVEAALRRPVEIVSCYEAGYDGFWLHRLLVQHDVRNHVFDPASMQVNRRARRAKTDRIDVMALVRTLMAHVRGEPKVVSVVRVPSVAEEDARRLHRERARLINERVAHVNRIKGLCATQGIYDYEPLRCDRRKQLAQLRSANGDQLGRQLAAEIEHEIDRLELVLKMIRTLEAERDAIVAGKVPAHPNAEKVQRLNKLKAVGPEFATAMVGEVFYRSFANRRQVASFVGLAASPFQSGGSAREQGITKAGNPKARTTMIELAWVWLRHQPDSALSIWFRERVGSLKGRPRRIAIVALARKLLVALWRYLETGLVPAGAVLKG